MDLFYSGKLIKLVKNVIEWNHMWVRIVNRPLALCANKIYN